MLKLIRSALALVLLATPALADPVEGVWKTEVDDGAYAHVTFAPCGEAYCGLISRTFNASGEYDSANKGKPIVWDMQSEGDGKYRDGKIWQPSSDKVYRSKMQLSGDSLQVAGCVGPICKKQLWTRVR
ncbi:Uncharacterized conserved protein, DUF2147 family [Pseudooceanicola antarcticus]|uniref:DUF2147 domain-containing protein n=1 Tax=Pseudooceanicola antarcticus TaxID=1247613 RepID=A0A285JF54_9RHOB|nr:DUF2147 domain-containing protein [Pseudooceanicola antarcticus]PJE31030.1 DUF2147 domain-containing protein [Pseudooceanicola antarcticus]SNY58904.1 Uncharacterized conserved protein, DUF2147 family [Pseudooceanicola antarcticus]